MSGRVRVELVGPRFCADVAWQLTWLRDTAGRWLAPVSHHVERIWRGMRRSQSMHSTVQPLPVLARCIRWWARPSVFGYDSRPGYWVYSNIMINGGEGGGRGFL